MTTNQSPAEQAAADQAAAEAKAAEAAKHRNSAKPAAPAADPAPMSSPQDTADAAPCEGCVQNAARLESLEFRVNAIAKLVATATLAGCAVALLWMLRSSMPGARVTVTAETAE